MKRGRKETFEIAANEQLIGCELSKNCAKILGITWIKIQTSF